MKINAINWICFIGNQVQQQFLAEKCILVSTTQKCTLHVSTANAIKLFRGEKALFIRDRREVSRVICFFCSRFCPKDFLVVLCAADATWKMNWKIFLFGDRMCIRFFFYLFSKQRSYTWIIQFLLSTYFSCSISGSKQIKYYLNTNAFVFFIYSIEFNVTMAW